MVWCDSGSNQVAVLVVLVETQVSDVLCDFLTLFLNSPRLLAKSIPLCGGDLPAQLLGFRVLIRNLLEMFEQAKKKKIPVSLQADRDFVGNNLFCSGLKLTTVNLRETPSGCCEA